LIRVFAVLERISGNGELIYRDDNFPEFEPALFWGFFSALNSFTKELYGRDEELKESEMESIKVVLFSPSGDYEEFDQETDPAFVIIADKYDNKDFLLKKLRKIYEILAPYLAFYFTPMGKVATMPVPDEIMDDVIKIIKYSQHFPPEIIKKLYLQNLLQNPNDFMKFTHVYLGDVDEGIIFAAESKKDSGGVKVADMFQLRAHTNPQNRLEARILGPLETREVFLELLKEIPFNQDLFLETHVRATASPLSKEAFIINQISPNSEFYLMARLLFDPDHRDEVSSLLKAETSRIWEALCLRDTGQSGGIL